MHRAEEYLRRAYEAEAKAEAIPLLRSSFLDLAHQWRELARQARGLAAHEATKIPKEAARVLKPSDEE